jgi:HAD superfamily hydrolase (TIGR01484 family)
MCANRIAAILSDYDGTLCPTSSVRNKAGTIPGGLEKVLWSISRQIPVCIISSKDYHFLHPRTKFARVLSCIMGIETISFRIAKGLTYGIQGARFESSNNNETYNKISYSIEKVHLLPKSRKVLQINSDLLSRLAEDIELEYKNKVTVDRKFTSERRYLAGITIDYRYLKNWKLYKNKLEPSLKEMFHKYRSLSARSMSDLYVLTYRSHPFIDVYGLYSDKGIAFDFITTKILDAKNNKSTLYLGDSENDNAAFRKASVSVGVVSDKRLQPKLDCQYLIEFENLSEFIRRLAENGFMFSEDVLTFGKQT